MTAIFVTATGTDIGKTFVTAGLVRALAARGRAASALKPVVSGFVMDAPEGSDPDVLLRAMGEPVTPRSIARISPWRFRAPLSPDMAAAREGQVIDFAELVGFCRDAIASAQDLLLIEGVGGVMVPLDSRHTVLDWIAALDIPVILVTGTYLGTLSHTLSAVAALERRGIGLRALVVNESENAPVPTEETIATLWRFLQTIPIHSVPRTKDSKPPQDVFERLCGHLEEP